MTRVVWDMRFPPARKAPGDKTTDEIVTGPLAPPGTYQVSLTVSGQTQSETFQVAKDPRVAAEQADFDAQFQLHVRVRDKLSDTHDSIGQLRSVRNQVEEWAKRAAEQPSGEPVVEAAGSLKEKLTGIENELIQAGHTGARHRLHLPVKLNRQLAELIAVIASADFAPPEQTYQVFDELSGRIDGQVRLLRNLLDEDVPRFTELVHELQIPAIVPTVST